ncbi:hypothetical protein VTH06DRAFT_4991 [Thermothelomyces fergusii]
MCGHRPQRNKSDGNQILPEGANTHAYTYPIVSPFPLSPLGLPSSPKLRVACLAQDPRVSSIASPNRAFEPDK